MGWTEVSLKDISPNVEILPEKEFTLKLTGAKYGNNGRINLTAQVVDDGEFTGRKAYFDYPDPDSQPWALHALKRLEIALGVDQEEGEDIVQYLNRAANLGAKFSSNFKHRKYTPPGGEEKTKSELNINAVRAAA